MADQGSTCGVEKRPCRLEGFGCGIPCAGDAKTDEASAGGGVGLHDFIEPLLQFLRPLARDHLLGAKFNRDASRCFRIVGVRGEVHVIFGKARASLTPSPCEGNSYGIEYGRLPRIILADKNSRLPKLHVEVLDRTKILYPKAGYAHCLPFIGPFVLARPVTKISLWTFHACGKKVRIGDDPARMQTAVTYLNRARGISARKNGGRTDVVATMLGVSRRPRENPRKIANTR